MGPTLVEVWAPWCSACKAIEPDLLEEAAEWSGRVRLERVDVASDFERSSELRVMGTPTLIGIRDGSEVFRYTGRLSRDDIRGLFANLADGSGTTRPSRRSESVLSIGAGGLLVAAGAAIGPSLPLAIVGLGVLSLGLAMLMRGQRADRS